MVVIIQMILGIIQLFLIYDIKRIKKILQKFNVKILIDSIKEASC